MERKKILITIDWFLPGTKSGGPVRSYTNMIAHLGKYHDFYIVTRDSDYCSEEIYPNIKSNAWNQLDKHTFVYYFSKDQLNKSNIKKLLNETPFDIAYINGIYSWYFSILPLWLLRKKTNVIVAARGMLNSQAFSVKKTKKKVYLTLANTLGIYKNVTFHATNAEEAKQISGQVYRYKSIQIAPNLPRNVSIELVISEKHKDVTHFVNIARVSIEKGTLKMIDALQNVTRPMHLDIYGPIYDAAYWEKCQNSIKLLPNHVTVEYKGVLPSEAVPEVLRLYDFFILLSEGENFGHAILEALTAGCPVIISDKTPWKHLEKDQIGWDINIENSNEIVKVIETSCQMSAEDYKEWSNNAVEFSREFFENPELLQLNLELFSDVL